MTTHDMIVMLCPKAPLYFTSHRGYFLSSQNETHVMMQLCPLNKAKWIFCTRWHFLLLSASKMCTHLLFIVLFWKLKEIWLDLTDTQKRTLTQYSVNNERIRELVLNGGHGSWLTYLPIRLCFLKPQLFFSVLKASQSDKPPLLPPSLGMDDAVVTATLRQATTSRHTSPFFWSSDVIPDMETDRGDSRTQ